MSKRAKRGADDGERPTMPPPFDLQRYARTTGRPTPHPETQSKGQPRPRAPSNTVPLRPLVPRRHSPTSLQAAVTRMLDRAPDGSGAATLAMLDRVPVVRMGVRELGALSLDHRAGFVLSLVDGTMTVSTMLDLCAMPHEEALAILKTLLERGAISLR